MGDVVDLPKRDPKKAGKERRKARAQGKTLCARGFHKWQIDQRKQFDVKKGKLVTVERCARCGAERSKAT